MIVFTVFTGIILHWLVCMAGWSMIRKSYGVQVVEEHEREMDKIPDIMVPVLIGIATLVTCIFCNWVLLGEVR